MLLLQVLLELQWLLLLPVIYAATFDEI